MFVYPVQVFICTAGSRGTGAEGATCKWLEKLSMNSFMAVVLSVWSVCNPEHFVVQPKKAAATASAVR